MRELLQKAQRIFFSDSHIPRNNYFFLEWLDAVVSDSKAVVYGIGDVFELLECTRDEVLDKGSSEIALLRKLAKDKRLRLLSGNHDLDAGRCLGFPPYFKQDRVGYFIGDKFYWLMHGHQFDWACKYMPWKWLSKILPWFMTPGKAKDKQKEKIYHNAVNRVLQAIYKKNINIIFGHTHWAGIIERENRCVLVNLGDMLGSCTWAMQIGNIIYLCQKWEMIGSAK